MYRIYRFYNGRKYYDSAVYTEREARREMRLLNRDIKLYGGAAFFLEKIEIPR